MDPLHNEHIELKPQTRERHIYVTFKFAAKEAPNGNSVQKSVHKISFNFPRSECHYSSDNIRGHNSYFRHYHHLTLGNEKAEEKERCGSRIQVNEQLRKITAIK